ncbi:MAG: hypothetical protein J0H44_04090 [Alphaproteobacteria bacterium]|nr:hypothetical protein [Alphaproteobacteria bacterium]
MNELVSAKEMTVPADLPPAKSSEELWSRFEAAKGTDPQFQISEELPGVFLPAAAFLAAAGDGEFLELGSTFFVSIEKLDLCSRLLGTPIDRGSMLFSGIEYSPFLKRVAVQLHPGDNLQLVTEPKEWKRSRDYAFHVSRFVGSYAFRSTEAFASEIARCDAFHIIDAFSLGRDFHSWDLGLPITFFDLEAMIRGLPDFDIYLTKATPEYHYAGRLKAMVLRLFGIKRDTARRLDYWDRFPDGFERTFTARRIVDASISIEIDRSLSAEQWEAFAEYKKHFPIWSGPPGLSTRAVGELVAPGNIDLHFGGEAIAEAVRRTKWLD